MDLLGIGDIVVPTVDAGFLAVSQQEQEVTNTVSGALTPGTSTQIFATPPRAGYWLLDWCGVHTVGPVTSGSISAQIYASIPRSGVTTAFLGIVPETTLNRQGGQTVAVGKQFFPPLVLFAVGSVFDRIAATITNAAASVGNVSPTLSCLWRQLELGKESP